MLPLAEWRAQRLAALTAPDGWLNLTDRVELQPGPLTVGSGQGAQVRLSTGPELLGTLRVGDPTTLTTPDGTVHAFQPQPESGPRLHLAGLLLEIHTVEGQPALRVRDLSLHPDPHLRYFPEAPEWVITATWQALEVPRTAQLDTVGGRSEVVQLTHRATFHHQGRLVSLLPTHWKAGKPMFVIRDQTSGHETYRAARFLIGEDVTETTVTLDFNRAFTPPCCFTDCAVCPLPPRENILPFRIDAGELAPQM